MVNPFTPGFGESPRYGVGAAEPLDEYQRALASSRSTGKTVLISGSRGTGKTVLLNEMTQRAREAGWAAVPLYTSSRSMVDELRSEATQVLRKLDPEATASRTTSAGASAAGFGINGGRQVLDRYEGTPESLGAVLDRVVTLAGARGGGLMLTIDEIQAADPQQLRELAQRVQTQVGQGGQISFVAAGIRSGVDGLLENEGTTFLRRAHRIDLEAVDVGSAAEVVRMTVADTQKTITPEAAVEAGEISQGYPYLIQLVGSKAWENAQDSPTIELEDARAARKPAIAEMIKNVHGPALRNLSDRKLDYLMAMAQDTEGPSSTSEIAARMGESMKFQSVYRDRLIRDDLIRATGMGKVEYSLPYLREAVMDKHAGTNRFAPSRSASIARMSTHRSRRGDQHRA